jgi:hypothetical protein
MANSDVTLFNFDQIFSNEDNYAINLHFVKCIHEKQKDEGYTCLATIPVWNECAEVMIPESALITKEDGSLWVKKGVYKGWWYCLPNDDQWRSCIIVIDDVTTITNAYSC